MAKDFFNTDRFSKIQTIGEGISEMMEAFRLDNKYNQTLIISKWESILGSSVANRTEKIYFKKDSMYVVITSAPLKHQLSLSKSKIIEKLNDAVKMEIVKEIVFL